MKNNLVSRYSTLMLGARYRWEYFRANHLRKWIRQILLYLVFMLLGFGFGYRGAIHDLILGNSEDNIVLQLILKNQLDIDTSANIYDINPTPESLAALYPKEENEAAPVSVKQLDRGKKDVPKYIERFWDVAVSEEIKYGIPAYITMAQGIIEGRAGTSTLASENNNHFGIKCFSKTCKAGHCRNLKDDHHKDFFFNYETAWESYRAHSILLTRKRKDKRYEFLFDLEKSDYESWCKGLKKAGYATDKKYDKKLLGVIKKYKLYKKWEKTSEKKK